MSRDEDLDELERDLKRPFIHEPDVKDRAPGMECWLDQTRVCGPACMAYNTDEIDEKGNVVDGPDRCLILFSLGAQGAAATLGIAASVGVIKRAQEAVMKQQEDAERGPLPTPPKGHT